MRDFIIQSDLTLSTSSKKGYPVCLVGCGRNLIWVEIITS